MQHSAESASPATRTGVRFSLEVHPILNMLKRLAVNNRRMMILHEIPVNLAAVFYVLLGQMICAKVFLHQYVAAVFFIAK